VLVHEAVLCEGRRMADGAVPQVLLMPGAVLPAAAAYEGLLQHLGDGVAARLKDPELYAQGAPAQDWTLDSEVDGVLAAADAAGFERFHFVG
jgi:hypothetical protein